MRYATHTRAATLVGVNKNGVFDGAVPKWSNTTNSWQAAVDVQGGGGFGAALGWQFVNAAASGNTGDGLSPATAKRDIQAAVTALPSGGGVVWLGSNAEHSPGSTVTDGGKSVQFRGMGPMGSVIRFTSNWGAAFHLQQRWSGVMDLQIATNGTTATQSNVGGIIMQEKNQYVERVNFWNIGQAVTGSFDARDPVSPFCIKMAGVSVNLSNPAAAPPTEELSDWLVVRGCYFFRVYRGLVIYQGVNGHFSQLTGDSDRGAWLYAERGGSGLNTSFTLSDTHVVHGGDYVTGQRDTGYMVYLGALSTQRFMQARFQGVRTESFGTGPAFYWVDTYRNMWSGCTFGGTGGQQRMIDFGPNGANSGIGSHERNLVYPVSNSRSQGYGGINGGNVNFVNFVPTQAGP